MNFIPLHTFRFVLLCFVFSLNTVQSEIIEITEIDKVREYVEKGTIFLFDVDDTLIDLPCVHLGGPAWKEWAEINLDTTHVNFDLSDAISLYLAKKLPYKPVEKTTTKLIRELQEQNITVLGYTARGRNLWCLMHVRGVDEFTHSQLQNVGIDFTDSKIPEEFSCILDPSYFYKGIFYSARIPKGDLLRQLFLQHSFFPKRIVFIDDRLAQVESVDAALTELGIPVVSVWYRFTALEQENFNPIAANVQLSALLFEDQFIKDESAEKEAELLKGTIPERHLNRIVSEFGKNKFLPFNLN